MSNSNPRKGLKRQVGLSLFSAIIVVLTVLGNFVRFGPVPITLSLAPIIIGAAVYGARQALCWAACSVWSFFSAVFSAGTAARSCSSWGSIPSAAILICIGKGILAGYLSGLAYRAIEKKSPLAAVVTAGIVCPVVNTGLFILGMLVFYGSTLQSWAGGQNVIYYAIFGLAGINFVVELLVNLVLSSGITTVIKYAASRR